MGKDEGTVHPELGGRGHQVLGLRYLELGVWGSCLESQQRCVVRASSASGHCLALVNFSKSDRRKNSSPVARVCHRAASPWRWSPRSQSPVPDSCLDSVG